MNKQLIHGFVLLAGLAVVSLWLLVQFTSLFSSADASVQAAIVAGGVALVSILFTILRERSKAIREAHREKKIEVYNQFFDIIFDFLKDPSKVNDLEGVDRSSPIVQKLMDISRGALLYGSPKVILAFAEWRTSSQKVSGDRYAPIRAIGKILLAMRSDIGLSNWGLNEINVHQIYVTDDLNELGKVK